MTTLIAVESPQHVDFIAPISANYVLNDEQTYVVHAPEGSDDSADWSECRAWCETREETWKFHLARGADTPAECLIEFADDHSVDRMVLITPDRTMTGKVSTGPTVKDILLADTVRGEFAIDDDFLLFSDLTYS